MQFGEMIQRMDEPDEPGAYCAQIGSLQRERCEETVDPFAPFGRRVVRNGFAG
jgi:hypothetical protein